jgi:hypothetical protein
MTDDKLQLIAIAVELETALARMTKLRLRIETETIELERSLVNATADLHSIIKDAKHCLPSP